jgi:hypothetical protein
MNYGSSHEEDDGRGNECIRIDDTEYESSFSRDPTNDRIESIICKYLYASSGKVKDADTKTRKARPIKNFKQSINVNQKLSELAFALV